MLHAGGGAGKTGKTESPHLTPTPSEIQAVAEAYAQEHALRLAQELVLFHESGFLHGGKLRQLAAILQPLTQRMNLMVAESFATKEILRQFVKDRS